MEAGNEKGRRFKLAVRVICIVLVLGLAAFIATQLYFQHKKLAEIRSETARLRQQIEELTREKERLESNLEYVKSPEGLLQYAREYLGYTLPDDVRIDVTE